MSYDVTVCDVMTTQHDVIWHLWGRILTEPFCYDMTSWRHSMTSWQPLTTFGQKYWQWGHVAGGHVAGGRVNAQAFSLSLQLWKAHIIVSACFRICFICIVCYCTMYCIVCYCIVCYCIVLYVIVLYCIVCYCIVYYCIVCYCMLLYCIVCYCIVLYVIVLYCIP